MRKRPKLEIPFLDQLPQPPEAVANAIWSWQQWLRFLPSVGPRPQTMCGGIEKEYRHVARKLQCQYHPSDPDEKNMYDFWLGVNTEKHINSLPPKRRDIVRGIHIHHTPIPTMLYRLKMREEQFHQELRSAYNQLAGKLCIK